MTSDPATELTLFSISEDLVPSPISTPSQQVTLAFDGLLTPPLVLQTNETECGGKLWPAGMVLAEYLLRNRMAEMEGKTMFVRSGASFHEQLTQRRAGCLVPLTRTSLIELSSVLAAGLWGTLFRRPVQECEALTLLIKALPSQSVSITLPALEPPRRSTSRTATRRSFRSYGKISLSISPIYTPRPPLFHTSYLGANRCLRRYPVRQISC